MKSTLAIVGCAIVAFIGMQVYITVQKSEEPPTPVEEQKVAEKPKVEEEPAPRPRPKYRPVSTSSSNSSGSRSTAKTPVKSSKPKTTTTKKKPPADMYFTIVSRNKNGSPSRITVHNTPIGNCTILLIGGGSSTSFKTSGTTSGSEKHRWEVQYAGGITTVLWDGKSARQSR